jgi:formylglycine-generating enzyme required for sulfatase activity
MKRVRLVLGTLLLAAGCLAQVARAEEPLTQAANGMAIFAPMEARTTEAQDGAAKVTIPAGMVYMPAGKFTFGAGREAREVTLEAYAIGRFEVTNAEYRAFLDATGERRAPRYWRDGSYPEGKANHPVLFVSLEDAEGYCAWVSRATGWKVTIPSAEQWEKAARGPAGWLYPWGNEKGSSYVDGKLTSHFNYNAVCAAHYLNDEAATMTAYGSRSTRPGAAVRVAEIATSNGQRFSVSADGNVSGWIDHGANLGFVGTEIYRRLVEDGGYTLPVGSFENGKSAYGCYDMAGNAYEWTSTVIIATNGAERGRQVNEVRGGSWYSVGRSGVSIGTGEGRDRRGGYHSVGFRVAAVWK